MRPGVGCAVCSSKRVTFASGTSSKSGKLIHGGLRYLKYRQWRLVLEACRERWLLQTKIAPHLVRPIRFVVPHLHHESDASLDVVAGTVGVRAIVTGSQRRDTSECSRRENWPR